MRVVLARDEREMLVSAKGDVVVNRDGVLGSFFPKKI